ncbi:MAG: flagellar hook-length control protein FliK [Rhizomicrobium sp.]
MPNAVTSVTGAQPAPRAGAGAVFAALLAKLNPAAGAQSSTPTDALAKTSAATGGQATAEPAKTDSNANDAAAAALAGQQVATPLAIQQTVLPKGADAVAGAIEDKFQPFANLKSVNPAQLRAMLTPQAQAPIVKPGTPTLPVMPAHAGDDLDETGTPGDAAAKDAIAKDLAANDTPAQADAGKLAQHLLRPATPQQTTEAQTLPVKFDARPDSQDGGGNGQGAPQDNSQNHQPAPANAPQPAAPSYSAPPSAQQAAASAAQHTDVKTAQPSAPPNSAIGAATPIQQALAPQAAAALHIAQASHSAPQPDLSALAVNIAAKSLAGSKQFDIRLDPAELGRIEVRLSVDDSGKAQAHLSADKPQTLALLQRDSSTLSQALKDSGVDVGGGGLSFSLRGQDRDTGGAPQSFARGRALSITAVTEATPAIPVHNIASDRLDIRV